MELGWRVEPFGSRPANRSDFPGGAFPHGTVRLSKTHGPHRTDGPWAQFEIEAVDDGVTEMNETFRLVLTDLRTGAVLWGRNAPHPLRQGQTLVWNPNHFENTLIMTILDRPRHCAKVRPGSGFTVAQVAPGEAYVSRPNRLIEQCEDVAWRAVPAGGRPLRPSDFKGRKYPSGVLRFSALADGSEDMDSSLPLRLPFAAPEAGRRGRTLGIVIHEVDWPGRVIDRTELRFR
jgi:hypothetical protein